MVLLLGVNSALIVPIKMNRITTDMFMKFSLLKFSLLLLVSISSCQKNSKREPQKKGNLELPKYAKGYGILKGEHFTQIDVYRPWPNAKDTLHLQFSSDHNYIKAHPKTIQTPLTRIVACSTTDIPSLEALGEISALIGFPETDYISSKTTRKQIDLGNIKEIGGLLHLNTETVLDLSPQLFIGFSSQKENKSFQLLERLGIPVFMNGSWLENHPLGRAEWIKVFGVLFHKEKEAEAYFNGIEKAYLALKKKAKKANFSPTVLSGNLYKDIWYTPAGESYAAELLRDANANYLWGDSKGEGSHALSFEVILEKGQKAEYWIGGGNFKTIKALTTFEEKYNLFDVVKSQKIYSKDLKKGAKKGILYYEQGALRPDWVLADLIYIFHPELLPGHQFHFYQKLN